MEFISPPNIFPIELIPFVAVITTGEFYEMKRERFPEVIDFFLSSTEIIFE